MPEILILTAYYRPEAIASSYLDDNRDEAFVRNGFDVRVYTPTPCRGISREVRKAYGKKRRETLHEGRLHIRRFRLFGEGRNPLLRALRYTLCCIKLFNRGVFTRRGDLLFVGSTPPILGATAALVKKCRHIPLVYTLQDIFPDSLVSTGLTRSGSLVWRIGRRIEDFTYRHADRIIVISDDFKRNLLSKGVPEEKIEVVYNWVDEQAVVPVEREANRLTERYGLDKEKFYVTYCGNIGLTQNMDMLLEAAEALRFYEEIVFVLIGEGAYKNEVIARTAARGLENVKILPFQPYEDISHVFSLGDVGLVISKPGVGANSVPSKTWNIMSAGRPVLASFDENSLKEIIERQETGLFTKAGDTEAFVEALLFLYTHQETARTFGANGRRFVLDNLTREAGTSAYVNIIRKAIDKNSDPHE